MAGEAGGEARGHRELDPMIREEATEPMTNEQWMCGSVTLVAAAATAMRRATEAPAPRPDGEAQ